MKGRNVTIRPGERIGAFAMSIVLVLGMGPGAALAADESHGGMDPGGEPEAAVAETQPIEDSAEMALTIESWDDESDDEGEGAFEELDDSYFWIEDEDTEYLEIGSPVVIDYYSSYDDDAYEVSYQGADGTTLEGAPAEPGNYYIAFTGANGYTGTVRIAFSIVENPVKTIAFAATTDNSAF